MSSPLSRERVAALIAVGGYWEVVLLDTNYGSNDPPTWDHCKFTTLDLAKAWACQQIENMCDKTPTKIFELINSLPWTNDTSILLARNCVHLRIRHVYPEVFEDVDGVGHSSEDGCVDGGFVASDTATAVVGKTYAMTNYYKKYGGSGGWDRGREKGETGYDYSHDCEDAVVATASDDDSE